MNSLFIVAASIALPLHSAFINVVKQQHEIAATQLRCSYANNCHAHAPLHKYNSDHWHYFCDDIDASLQGLVSPAPESFHVLHSIISKIDNVTLLRDCDEDCSNYLNDVCALSFLVKPIYSIQLYCDSDAVKWRLIPRNDCHNSVIYPSDFRIGKNQVYHQYNTLELSRKALDVATHSSCGNTSCLESVLEIARQAEVCWSQETKFPFFFYFHLYSPS